MQELQGFVHDIEFGRELHGNVEFRLSTPGIEVWFCWLPDLLCEAVSCGEVALQYFEVPRKQGLGCRDIRNQEIMTMVKGIERRTVRHQTRHDAERTCTRLREP